MEFRTIKEDGQVQEEIKNLALSAMQSVSIERKRRVIYHCYQKRTLQGHP